MPHSEHEARQILTPYLDEFGRIFPMAWDRWERFGENVPELRLQVCPRTRASMLNNFGVHAAEEIFSGMAPNVVLTDQPGFLLIIVESKLHVRLKKYRGRTCQTSGIPTDQRKLFENQQPILGFPEASNCVHGYVLRRDASGIAETAIKCSTGRVLHWKIEVPMVESGRIEELPTPLRTEEVAEPRIASTLRDRRPIEEGRISG